MSNYGGPASGYFAFVHHDELFEWSDDITGRVEYVRERKPKHELPIRTSHMIVLGGMSGYENMVAQLTPLRLESNKTRKRHFRARTYRTWTSWTEENCNKAWVECLKARTEYRKVCAEFSPQVLLYTKTQIPDCAWNGTELVFPKEST
jgi:hypothetical protein